MARYEYIRLDFDPGELSQLNRFASDGWRVVATIQAYDTTYLLLEREVEEK